MEKRKDPAHGSSTRGPPARDVQHATNVDAQHEVYRLLRVPDHRGHRPIIAFDACSIGCFTVTFQNVVGDFDAVLRASHSNINGAVAVRGGDSGGVMCAFDAPRCSLPPSERRRRNRRLALPIACLFPVVVPFNADLQGLFVITPPDMQLGGRRRVSGNVVILLYKSKFRRGFYSTSCAIKSRPA